MNILTLRKIQTFIDKKLKYLLGFIGPEVAVFGVAEYNREALHGDELKLDKKRQKLWRFGKQRILKYVHQTVDVLHVHKFGVGRNHPDNNKINKFNAKLNCETNQEYNKPFCKHYFEQPNEHTECWYFVGYELTITDQNKQVVEKPALMTHYFIGNIGHGGYIGY